MTKDSGANSTPRDRVSAAFLNLVQKPEPSASESKKDDQVWTACKLCNMGTKS